MTSKGISLRRGQNDGVVPRRGARRRQLEWPALTPPGARRIQAAVVSRWLLLLLMVVTAAALLREHPKQHGTHPRPRGRFASLPSPIVPLSRGAASSNRRGRAAPAWGAKKKETAEEEVDPPSSSPFSLSGFWNWARKETGDAKKGSSGSGDEKSSRRADGIPLLGRLFSPGERDDQEDGGEGDADGDGSSASRLARLLQKRQMGRDAEELREEVLRREEEKKRLVEEQQRAAEAARERTRAAAERVRATRAARAEKQADVDRRIQGQKDGDQRRKDRVAKLRKEREQRELPSKLQAELDRDKRREARTKASSMSSGALRATLSASTSSTPSSKAPTMKRAKKDRRGDKDKEGGDNDNGRFNAVSVAQKFVTNLVDSLTPKEEWIVVAPKTRISPGEIVPVTVAGLDLLLVASRDGSALHCIANSCPHLGTPLELATLERRPIEVSRSSGAGSAPAGGGSSTAAPAESSAGPFLSPTSLFMEKDIARMLKQDGCEDCVVCPLHRTAFALESGEVRGEWCPYPPVIGKMTGAVKKESNLAVFDVRTKGKNIEVRLNTPLPAND